MIKIAICDDNIPIVDMLYIIIRRYNFGDEEITLHKYYDNIPLVKAINEGIRYDIIFMDIRYKRQGFGEDFNGIHATERINNIAPLTIMVCMSQYEYYKDLSKVETFYFLEKPFQEPDIIKVLEKALNKIRAITSNFDYYYKVNGISFKLDLKKVEYFSSMRRKINVRLTYETEELSFYGKLDVIEKEIKSIYSRFLRINKSYLVNRDYIKAYTKNRVFMDGIEILVSRKYLKIFKNYISTIKDMFNIKINYVLCQLLQDSRKFLNPY